MSKPRIADVADAAGVSTSTASDAYVRPDRLAPETLAKVLRAARGIGYERRSYSRRPAESWIGYLMPRMEESLERRSEWWTRDMVSIQLAAFDLGMRAIAVPYDPDAQTGEVDALSAAWTNPFIKAFVLSDGRPHGVDSRHDWLLENGVPFVQHGRGTDESRFNWLDLDDQDAIRALTDALIDLGHDRVAHLGFRADGTGPPANRRRGYLEALDRRGMSRTAVVKEVSHGDVHDSPADFNAVIDAMLAEHSPTAVVCVSDDVAIGAQRHLLHIGRADIQLTGLDDSSARRSLTNPFPSAGCDWNQWARTSLLFAQAAIRDRSRPLHDLQPMQLVDMQLMKPPRPSS